MSDFRDTVLSVITTLQADMTAALEAVEGQPFVRDSWTREDGNGFGQANIIQKGRVFQKGGVNFTRITMPLNPGIAKAMSDRGKQIDTSVLAEYSLFAVGVSMVIHPVNPMVPTIHLNYRYLEITRQDQVIDWWFAGGSDLTPYYLFPEDCRLFHRTLKQATDLYDESFYPAFKKECDQYFFITHRGFARGVGGIFFDDLNTLEPTVLLEMLQSCGRAFIEAYPEIVRRRMDLPYTKAEVHWQEVRRGHYVEFNLCYDRGTKFGLMTPDANLEAIFMPMPLKARWEYKLKYDSGSREAELLAVLREPKDWAVDEA
jgi:coproporphyrinogen III oxidase